MSKVDQAVGSAFNKFVCEESCLSLLGRIAYQPGRRQETAVSNLFRDALDETTPFALRVWREYPHPRPDQRDHTYDIGVIWPKQIPETIAVVEVKTPFTNPGGITSRRRALSKDVGALKAALDAGVPAAYELVVLFGCYRVDKNGDPADVNEKDIEKESRIHWTTEGGYQEEDRRKLESILVPPAKEQNLDIKRINGWEYVALPSPQSNVRSFLDCALYRIRRATS